MSVSALASCDAKTVFFVAPVADGILSMRQFLEQSANAGATKKTAAEVTQLCQQLETLASKL